jgi:hypothetical protein
MASLPQRWLKQPTSIVLLASTVLLAVSGHAAAQQGLGDALLARSGGNAAMEIELPKMKVRKKDKPLDEQVRVGLYLPMQLRRDPQLYSLDVEMSEWRELLHQGLVEAGHLHLSKERVKIFFKGSVDGNSCHGASIQASLRASRGDLTQPLSTNDGPTRFVCRRGASQ